MLCQKIKNYISFSVIIIWASVLYSQDKIIDKKDHWYYYDQGYLNSDWFQKPIDNKWKLGITPIGYGDRLNTTTISFGDDSGNKEITKYFKKEFSLENLHRAYTFRVQYDDGFVIYINGKELYRVNMPNDPIVNKTFAISNINGYKEQEFDTKTFPPDAFKLGKNIISVSVHQSNGTSSDCIFSMELIGRNDAQALTKTTGEIKNESELQNAIKEIAYKNEVSRLKLQIENLNSGRSSLRFLLFIICFLLILALIGYYFVISNFKIRESKVKTELQELKEKMLAQEKDMLIISTNLLHNKQYFKEIKADLRGVKTEDKSTMRSIINQIDQVLDKDEEWERLKKHFNSVFEGFYDNLLEKHPTLTETELRHCMFIKLHMQTKEISRILLIDPRSVQTSRYRIKKKMNLDESTDLREHLFSI